MLKEAAELWLEGMDSEDKQYLPVREGTLTVDVAV
jgi:predicted RNase H-like HicB family nuclease